MAIRGQGMMDGDEAGESASAQTEDIVYVMHPNCAWEEPRGARAREEGAEGE